MWPYIKLNKSQWYREKNLPGSKFIHPSNNSCVPFVFQDQSRVWWCIVSNVANFFPLASNSNSNSRYQEIKKLVMDTRSSLQSESDEDLERKRN